MGGRPARLCRFPCCPGRGTHNPTQPHPGESGPHAPCWTCSLQPKPWFSRESASSLQELHWCCWELGPLWALEWPWKTPAPHPLPAKRFFMGYSSLRCTLVLKAPGGSHGAKLCLGAPTASCRGGCCSRGPRLPGLCVSPVSCLVTCPDLPGDSCSCSPFCLLPPYLTHDFLGI